MHKIACPLWGRPNPQQVVASPHVPSQLPAQPQAMLPRDRFPGIISIWTFWQKGGGSGSVKMGSGKPSCRRSNCPPCSPAPNASVQSRGSVRERVAGLEGLPTQRRERARQQQSIQTCSSPLSSATSPTAMRRRFPRWIPDMAVLPKNLSKTNRNLLKHKCCSRRRAS